MGKKIAILQSNYIPWKGYFDLINMVDEFVLFDEVQYTKNDWRNRNRIVTNQGTQWITIPVKQNKLDQLIEDTVVVDARWAKKHWSTVSQNYANTKYFKLYASIFEGLYLNAAKECRLSEINYQFILAINDILNIKTKIRWSNEFTLKDGKTEKLAGICVDANATEYVSGPAAKSYLNEDFFKKSNIEITWMNYSGYPEYEQLSSDFEHSVSVIDLIFNEGPSARHFMKSF